MAGPVVVRVNELGVQGFIEPGGAVYDAVATVVFSAYADAKLHAPKRTGALAANISYARPARRGGYEIEGYIYANIRYAMYVERGVPGRIYPKKGGQLSFRGYPSRVWVHKDSVRGQTGQHFMRKAIDNAMDRFRAGA